MALKPRRLWTGTKRADIQRMVRLCNQFKNWQTKPYPIPFLTPAQLIIVQSMLDNVCAPMLAATTPR